MAESGASARDLSSMTAPPTGYTAIDRFVNIKRTLPNAILPCVSRVVCLLHAEQLIEFELMFEIINMQETDEKKAIKLVMALEEQLRTEKNPDGFLKKLSSVLTRQGETGLTLLAESLISDVSDQSIDGSTTQADSKSQPPAVVSKADSKKKRKRRKGRGKIARNNNREVLLFRKYSSDFKRAILHPMELAGDLYSKNIIDEITRKKSQNSAEDLVNAVEAYVISQSSCTDTLVEKFEEILEIFEKYTPLCTIVEAVKDSYYGNAHSETRTREFSIKGQSDLPDSIEPEELTFCQSDTPIEPEGPVSMKQKFSGNSGNPQEDNKPNDCDIFSDSHLKELAIALQVYSRDLSESGLDAQATLNHIKARIETHIRKKLEDDLSKDDVMKHLTDLTMNALIPMDINDWCYSKLDEIFKELDSKVSGQDDSSSDDSSFCDLPPLFTKDAVYHASLCGLVLSNAKVETLNDYLSQFGHSFDEMTLSVSGNIKIFIAQQENIVYISFENTKGEHLRPQQLNFYYDVYEQQQAILMGHMPEELPLRYFCELLHCNKRLIFTGFSLGGAYAQSIVLKLWNLPYFSSDILTQNVACITFGLSFSILPREKAIQQSCHSFMMEDDLHWLVLKQNAFMIGPEFIGNTYLIQEKHDGVHCSKLDTPKLMDLRIGRDTSGFFPKFFTIERYHQNVLRGYLDKDPDCYSIPRRKSQPIAGVQSVLPSISKIELHQHKYPGGSELAIVINGDNLWFCNSIEVAIDDFKIHKFEISPELVTQKLISHSHVLMEAFVPKESDAHVKICSKFSKPIDDDVPMTYNEPDPISFRQSQLAKQTPSQIISLSFLSALLEQSPSVHSSRPTKRFNSIMKFLQEAASIVPMESIVFSIASTTNHATALKLAQTVVNEARETPLPVSKLMAVGCQEAAKALRGRHPYNYFYDDGEYLSDVSHHGVYYHGKVRGYGHQRRWGRSTQSVRLIGPRRAFSFDDVSKAIIRTARDLSARNSLRLICGRNIGEIYPISKAVTRTTDVNALTPLPQVLQKARKRLTALSIRHKDAKLGAAAENCNMLKEVNEIIEKDLNPCVTMLGGFMEQQIRVPLVNSNVLDTAKALRTAENSGAIGVWALFALSEKDIESIVSSKRNQTLVIQVAKFIEGVLSEDVVRRRQLHVDESTTSYDAKLQFLLQAMNKTVTCSSNYISYSLERELVTICKERKISTSTSIDHIVRNWDARFEATALALVPRLYRPLLARWLIWALNIHQLREGLARYTTVGVIGLVNSGKSTLVNKVFKIKTIQGTTQSARTTVPFIYNLDSSVEGLSVIDFPGVDDRDESIAGLAKLLVGLAQMIVFVCGYERFHTGSATEWMEIFKKDFSSTPILVCLTHADRLYENSCEDSMIPECPEEKIPALKMQFEDELEKIVEADTAHNCMIKFCSLTQTRHSPLNNEKGRQSMRKAGIFTPEDIGEWIKRTLTLNIQQQDLADKFDSFLKST